MKRLFYRLKREWGLSVGVGVLLVMSVVVLRSIAPEVFPVYYGYLGVGIACYVIFSEIDFEIFRMFSGYLYVVSVGLLVLTMILGDVTRGVVRWIPIGPWTIQPAEVVKPLLLVFFADYFTRERLSLRRFVWGTLMFFVPLSLIVLQPSLGVAVLMAVGFVGIVIALDFNKRILLAGMALFVAFAPLGWLLLAPYQKGRLKALVFPSEDPYGAGYNSIQAKITVGSGGWWGRGLGEGVQTQLKFLPEKQTDFIFASVSEEMGFVGGGLLIMVIFFVLLRVVEAIYSAKSLAARAFVSAVFLTLLGQVVVHIGMNMGILPITGIPLPLVSAGGSSLVGIMMMLGMVVGIKK